MKTTFKRSGREGFSLVEVTLALAIVVFCLTALTGLLWVGLSANATASGQSAASNILSAVVSDLRATPTTSTKSLLYGITLPTSPVTAATPVSLYVTADGATVTTAQNPSTYLLTVTFLPPGSAAASGARSRIATFADLKVSWPAAAAATNAKGTAETFVAIDRN